MLDAWVERNFLTESITLEKAGIKVFRSSQVNLKKINESLEYMIITTNMSFKKKIGANPKSLENQTLQVGDILISARAKLERINVVTEVNLGHGIPIVAMNGMIIIRTGDENLSNFIKYYLELPIVRDTINNDRRASKDGKRIIPIELITELHFPDFFKNNFQTFKEYTDYFKSISFTAHNISITLNKLVDLQLGVACANGIDNGNSYNPDDWKKLNESLNNLYVDLGKIAHSAEIPDGYTYGDEIIGMSPLLLDTRLPEPTPKKTK